jgi:trimeric autotransporter adhesin
MKDWARLIIAVSVALSLSSIGGGSAVARPSFASLSSKLQSNSAAEEASVRLPVDGEAAVSAALGRDDAHYRVEQNGGLQARNPVQALRTDFAREGIRVDADAGGQWGLTMKGWGHGDHLAQVQAAEPHRDGNRVEYQRGSLVEWYVNGPAGLEQGFTISARPTGDAQNLKTPGAHSSPLTIALATKGNLTAVGCPSRKKVGRAKDLTLCDGSGRSVLRYAGLDARDANGRELAAWIELDGRNLRLRVDDAGARYPVVIDPFIQVAKLTAPTSDFSGYFGASVSISGDGNTITVGAYGTKVGSTVREGAVYVFSNSPLGWKQSARLTPSDGVTNGQFGFAVSVNSNGSTIVAGGLGTPTGAGANVYVFSLLGGNYSQTAEFPDIDYPRSVAVSGDGKTIAVGNPSQNRSTGAVYVFSNDGSSWSLAATLIASDATEEDLLGYSVSISADGGTIVAGAPVNAAVGLHKRGTSYVFVKGGGGWAQAAKLLASDSRDDNQFGISVSASNEGGIIAVGAAPAFDAFGGAAYVFTISGKSWTQTAKLIGSSPAVSFFGISLALSADGSSIVVVGSADFTSVYTKKGNEWNVAGKLTAAGVSIYSVSLSGDGDTVVGGVPGAFPISYRDKDVQIPRGAAYVFDAN